MPPPAGPPGQVGHADGEEDVHADEMHE
jgi:hypothetical protein